MGQETLNSQPKKKAIEITGIILGSLDGLILLLVIFINIAGTKTFDAPYSDVKTSTDLLKAWK